MHNNNKKIIRANNTRTNALKTGTQEKKKTHITR